MKRESPVTESAATRSPTASARLDELVRDGVERLLGRATEMHALDAKQLCERVRGVVCKYLLRDEPEAPATKIAEFIDRIRADELCLVVRCEAGDEAAWRQLVEAYNPTVRQAARAACRGEAEAEELAQSIWAELYGLRDGRAGGKLGYYSGCGSLGGWLRAIVAQMSVDNHRRTSRLVQTEEATDFDRLAHTEAAQRQDHRHTFAVTPTLDPEASLTGRETSRTVNAALTRAMEELEAEDRLLLKLYYLDNLRLREAGAVLGVHEATASRRLARVHVALRERIEALLRIEYGWQPAEITRTFADAATHADVGLALLLGAPESSSETLH